MKEVDFDIISKKNKIKRQARTRCPAIINAPPVLRPFLQQLRKDLAILLPEGSILFLTYGYRNYPQSVTALRVTFLSPETNKLHSLNWHVSKILGLTLSESRGGVVLHGRVPGLEPAGHLVALISYAIHGRFQALQYKLL